MKLIMPRDNACPDTCMKPGTTIKAIEMYGQTTSQARILRALVDLMPEHAYTEEDVYKIPVANIMRVFDACRGGANVAIVVPPGLS